MKRCAPELKIGAMGKGAETSYLGYDHAQGHVVLSATAYHFKFELSPDGATWTTVLEGRATKR